MAIELVTLHPVDAPGALARTQLQAGLLGVDGEDRELRLGQCTWKRFEVDGDCEIVVCCTVSKIMKYCFSLFSFVAIFNLNALKDQFQIGSLSSIRTAVIIMGNTYNSMVCLSPSL